MAKYGFVIDLDRCMGCNACVEACKVENNTGQGIHWMYVFRLERGEYPHVEWLFLPRPCMHCDNAPCIKVCPVGARHKREDGLVLTHYDRCIGCRYCETACPYGLNYFNWRKPERNQYLDWIGAEGENVYGSGSVKDYIGDAIPPYQNPDHKKLYGDEKHRSLVSGGGHYDGVIEKCTWCVHRIEKNLVPACVANCPAYVLHFGDLENPNSVVSRMLAKRHSYRLLEEAGTDPRVYYLGGTIPSNEFKPGPVIPAEMRREGA
jgi:molybdopterin-containing oxidoreductase family iron-sulfur binding subunit